MKWFKNLKIRKKLLVGFIIMAFIAMILAMVGLVSVMTLKRLSTELHTLQEESNSISGVLDAHYVWRQGITEAVLIGSEFKGSLDPNTCALGKWYGSEKAKNINDPELLSKLKQIDEPHAFIHYEAKIVLKLIQDGNLQEAQNHLGKVIYPRTTEVISLLADMRTRYSYLVGIKDAESVRVSNFIIILNIAFIIVAIIIAIFLAFYISKMISAPLNLMHEKAQYMAKTGDLTTTIEVDSKDELGSMNGSLTKMIGNFATLIRKVMSDVEGITKESKELWIVSEVISDVSSNTSVELQSQTETAGSSSEQVSANVSMVASAVEELSTSIKEISKNTNSATTLTKKSEERANEASEVMNRLGQSSQEIGNIVKSITDIAEQTNLLALNATIEAARAGELGKGFAVVANEVKELAKESAKATEDITKKIKAIQDDTKNAIEVIKEIIDNAVKINEITTTIATEVEEQSVTANEVNRNISEATVGVGSIVKVITGITQATTEYAQQANNVKNISSTLKTLASDLDKQIKESFKV